MEFVIICEKQDITDHFLESVSRNSFLLFINKLDETSYRVDCLVIECKVRYVWFLLSVNFLPVYKFCVHCYNAVPANELATSAFHILFLLMLLLQVFHWSGKLKFMFGNEGFHEF